MINFCSDCGKAITGRVYSNNTCQACYNYFSKGGTVSPLPAKGIIAHDYRGCVICHICGRAYKKLGSHVRESHNMTASEYKETFGLCSNAQITESTYSSRMKDFAYKYRTPQRLQEVGKGTRIKSGEKGLRYGKKSRLQECLDKRNRYRKRET